MEKIIVKNIIIYFPCSKMHFGIKKLVLWEDVYLPTLNQFPGRLTFIYFEEIFKTLL